MRILSQSGIKAGTDASRVSIAGVNAFFVSLSSTASAGSQERLAARCSFPLFQDTGEGFANDAMREMGGAVYDMYVYDANGRLHAYLKDRVIETQLTKEEGYANVKEAVLSAVEAEHTFRHTLRTDGRRSD